MRIPAPEWEEITSQCKTLLVKSSSSDGHFVKLIYDGKTVALLGLTDGGFFQPGTSALHFKVEPATNALISFKVFKKND